MRPKGVWLFRGKCQTKELTISVLLDGDERPLSEMLKESYKQLTHHVHNETQDSLSVLRKMPDQRAPFLFSLIGGGRPLSKMLKES